jgi:hypothetical protein
MPGVFLAAMIMMEFHALTFRSAKIRAEAKADNEGFAAPVETV